MYRHKRSLLGAPGSCADTPSQGASLLRQGRRNPPAVTVSIPTRNRSSMLKACLTSVLAQTTQDLEVFVLDNASTDDTAQMVEGLGDPRVTLLALGSDVGMHGNMTRALHQGTAPYVVVLQDDDVLLPGSLSAKIAVLDARPEVGAVTSAFYFIDIDGRRTSGATNWMQADADRVESGSEFLMRTMGNALRMHISTVAVRRGLVASERFDVADAGHCDMALWLRLARHASVAYLHEPLAEIRHHVDAENIKDGTCEFIDGVPRITSFARLRVVHGVKQRFLAHYGGEVPDRQQAQAAARKYARHQIGQVLLQDALANKQPRRILRLLAEAAEIEKSVVASRWAAIPLLTATAGPRVLNLAEQLRGRAMADPAKV